LNPDTVASPGWLESLSQRFEDPNVAAVGPVSDSVSAAQFVGHHLPARYRGTAAAEDLTDAVRAAQPGASMESKLLIGFCLVVRRDVLDAAGLLALEALGHKIEPLSGAVVELGCWEGASTCALANAIHPERLIAVDTWQGNVDESPDHETVRLLRERDVKAVFEANLKAYTKGNVEPVQQDCHQFLSHYDCPVKLCHVDACHDYASVKRILEALLPKMVPGGVLCGDDILSAHVGRSDLQGGVERAVSELLPGYFRRGNFWYWVKAA